MFMSILMSIPIYVIVIIIFIVCIFIGTNKKLSLKWKIPILSLLILSMLIINIISLLMPLSVKNFFKVYKDLNIIQDEISKDTMLSIEKSKKSLDDVYSVNIVGDRFNKTFNVTVADKSDMILEYTYDMKNVKSWERVVKLFPFVNKDYRASIGISYHPEYGEYFYGNRPEGYALAYFEHLNENDKMYDSWKNSKIKGNWYMEIYDKEYRKMLKE